MAQKVLLGMSGGVDSSVAAVLLQKQGDQVGGGVGRGWRCVGGWDRKVGGEGEGG